MKLSVGLTVLFLFFSCTLLVIDVCHVRVRSHISYFPLFLFFHFPQHLEHDRKVSAFDVNFHTLFALQEHCREMQLDAYDDELSGRQPVLSQIQKNAVSSQPFLTPTSVSSSIELSQDSRFTPFRISSDLSHPGRSSFFPPSFNHQMRRQSDIPHHVHFREPEFQNVQLPKTTPKIQVHAPAPESPRRWSDAALGSSSCSTPLRSHDRYPSSNPMPFPKGMEVTRKSAYPSLDEQSGMLGPYFMLLCYFIIAKKQSVREIFVS